MYDLLRRIHLYTGMCILSFVVMYFITGYPMIHHKWFPEAEPVKSKRIEDLDYAGNPEELSIYLQEKFDLRGHRSELGKRRDGTRRFEFVRPGTFYQVSVNPEGTRAESAETHVGSTRTMIGFHRLHRYGGGGLYDLWILFYDLASFSLILFAATGIYMWYKLTKKKLLGWIFLGLSYGYATTTILYLMYAP